MLFPTIVQALLTVTCLKIFLVTTLVTYVIQNLYATRWKRIGYIKSIYMYPLKSGAACSLTKAVCTIQGVQNGLIRDRMFWIVRDNGKTIRGEHHKRVVLIDVQSNNDGLIEFSMKDGSCESLFLSLNELNGDYGSFKTCPKDCGPTAAEWISQAITDTPVGYRLIYQPPTPPTGRIYHKWSKYYPRIREQDGGVAPDKFAYCLTNERSLANLIARLNEPICEIQFRPNIHVDAGRAFDEDTWHHVKIGERVVLETVKKRATCLFVNVDRNGAMGREPLRLLNSFRRILPEFLRKVEPKGGVFGSYLELRVGGAIEVGDAVYVRR